jgi:translation initiation factor IF-1
MRNEPTAREQDTPAVTRPDGLVEAIVVAVLPNELFRLRLQDGKEITAHVSGNLRMAFTRLVPNTSVGIELSPFDPTRARILRCIESRGR